MKKKRGLIRAHLAVSNLLLPPAVALSASFARLTPARAHESISVGNDRPAQLDNIFYIFIFSFLRFNSSFRFLSLVIVVYIIFDCVSAFPLLARAARPSAGGHRFCCLLHPSPLA